MNNKRKHTGSESDKSDDERPVKSSNNEEPKQSEDDSKQPETTSRKTFAQTFAYLKNTDLYKLPEKPEEVPKAAPRNTNAIIVNSCQRGNPILKFVKNVPYEYGEIIPDYQIGERHCALFLSLRYHNLNQNYIHERLSLLGNKYDLRVILVLVDIKNCKHNLKELSKMCMLAGCTLILTWSAEEAGRYLETYKQYENKPPDILQERVETDYFSQVQDVLTTIKSINKTDAITLVSAFGSLKNIINASKEEVVLCPGFGQQKAQRLHKVFNEPFKRSVTNVSCSRQEESSPCVRDGQLPSTCKLKRPREINISLQKSESQSHKLKCSNLEKEKVIHAEPTLSSPITSMSVEESNMQSKDDNKLDSSLKEKSEKGTPTHKKTDSIVVNEKAVQNVFEEPPSKTQPSPRKHDSSDYSTTEVELQKPPKTSHTSNKSTSSNKINKTEAVYNSGLSRNRKEARVERDSKIAESSPQKTPDKRHNEKYSKSDKSPAKKTQDKDHNEKYPKLDKSPVKKTQDKDHNEKYSKLDKSPVKMTQEKHLNEKHAKTNKSLAQNTYKQYKEQKSRNRGNSESSQGSSNSESSQVAYKSKKLGSPSHNTSKKLDKSDVCGKTSAKDSHSASVTSKVTSRSLTADNDILLQNISKFRVGSRTKRTSEQENTPTKDSSYSTQITNDEFNDLLASDDDEEDIDIYADL